MCWELPGQAPGKETTILELSNNRPKYRPTPRPEHKPTWKLRGLRESASVMWLVVACSAGSWGMLTGLAASTNHPSAITAHKKKADMQWQ